MPEVWLGLEEYLRAQGGRIEDTTAGQEAETFDVMQRADDLAADPAHRADIDALMTEMNVEQNLIALRTERGLTQVQLAELLGVTQSTIARLESDEAKNVELKTLVRVAAALGARVKITFERYDRAAMPTAAPAMSKRG